MEYPLERLELSISGARLELSIERADLMSITDEKDRDTLLTKVNHLERK